ncbi:hypothetical protein [Salinactinospora qingdaonensis]|uniref:Uncharacterized protein n=1 Tax=Salinactinospora qingdaonensis TaxID=702744 RepID=A0ABP7G282_9ACTN
MSTNVCELLTRMGPEISPDRATRAGPLHESTGGHPQPTRIRGAALVGTSSSMHALTPEQQ